MTTIQGWKQMSKPVKVRCKQVRWEFGIQVELFQK